MEKQDVINILKQYNFLENSIRKFSLEYKITEKTVKKYLVENNIPYSKRTIKYEIPRDVNGRYKLKVNNDGLQSRPVDLRSNNQLNKVNNNQLNKVNNNNQIKKPKHSSAKAEDDLRSRTALHIEDSIVKDVKGLSNLRKGEALSQAKGCQRIENSLGLDRQSFSIDNFMKIKKNTKPFKTILQEMQKL